jgi:hypothetical protein
MAKQTKRSDTPNFLQDNYIYISHLDEDLQFWRLPASPDSIQDSMSSTFSSENVLGRSAPVYTYSNSGPRSVQISLKLHRDIMDDINEGYSNSELQGTGEDYVDNLIRALQAIALPKYNLNNKHVEPPLVAVRIENQLFIKGIVNGGVTVTYQKPILYNGKYAIVNVSFTIDEVDPYDATTVYKNGSFRGVVRTLKKGMNLED